MAAGRRSGTSSRTLPGKTYNGDTGDVADDSYHLYKEDVRLLKNLGVERISHVHLVVAHLSEGTGKANPKGLDYYNRVVDELLANNITPYITLFHWDLPAGAARAAGSRATHPRPLPTTRLM